MAPEAQNGLKAMFDDATLVKPRKVEHPGRWIAIFLASLAGIFAIYFIGFPGMERLGRPPITTDDEHQQKVIRFLQTDAPQAVLVGSSLCTYLRDEYFSDPNVRNLAFPGGGPVTGLQILEASGKAPRLVIVETNQLRCQADSRLVEHFRPMNPWLDRAKFLATDFKPLRVGTTLALNADPTSDTMNKNARPLGDQRAHYANRRQEILQQEPASYDIRQLSEVRYAELESQNDPEILRTNASEIVRIARVLEARGTKVVFLELPLAPKPMESRHLADVRQHLNAASEGDPSRWLQLQLDAPQLRWPDAYHLDERSSLMVIEALESQLRKELTDDKHSP